MTTKTPSFRNEMRRLRRYYMFQARHFCNPFRADYVAYAREANHRLVKSLVSIN